MENYDALKKILKSGQLNEFISKIRFPKYKNLVSNLEIKFDFPITALVGPNGSNKSSILRALYGAPDQYNLGNFWFSSNIDPIQEGGGERNCFIYEYYNTAAKRSVEVLKSRIKLKDDPDYWEPARPQVSYGMEPMPAHKKGDPLLGRSITRWDAIKKNVTYIDFRSSLSAFDKFFYHSDFRGNNLKEKKNRVRKYTAHLKIAIDKLYLDYVYYHKNRIINKYNKPLPEKECKIISHILGRNYHSIHLIRHSFYSEDAYTCLMTSGSLKYSEAFAGSGEFAVVKLVTDLLSSPANSLVLLDEPEVSLHPGAQERLVEFLVKQVLEKHHQIVMCTHSSYLIRTLPPEAIKVLQVDSSDKVFLEKQSSYPDEAFFHLGMLTTNKKLILVEDKLAFELIKRALHSLGEAILKTIEVKYFPGGASSLWMNQIAVYATENRVDVMVYFDGDLEPEHGIPDETSIPEADNPKLGNIIKELTGCNVSFNYDGTTTTLAKQQRLFLKWIKKNVKFLPGKCIPEELIWKKMLSDEVSKKIISTDYKENFLQLTKLELDVPDFSQVTSDDIFSTQKRKIATIPKTDELFISISNNIQTLF